MVAWVDALIQHGVPVIYAVGARDVLAPAHAVDRLGQAASAITVVSHPRGNHLLPLSDPTWCTALLRPHLGLRQSRSSAPRH
jgi:pimeloyl-ACP methyl ester carboxylesterase